MRMLRFGFGLVFAIAITSGCLCGGDRTVYVNAVMLVEPRSLDFGQQESGSLTTLALSIENTGTEVLELSELSLMEDARVAFTVGPWPTNVPPGERVSVEVTYRAPPQPGSDVATLHIVTNARSSPELLLSLVGVSASPCLPRSCEEVGSECGTRPECGALMDCGTCGSEATCVEHVCEGARDAGSEVDVEDAGTQDAGVEDAGTDPEPPDAGEDAGTSVDPSRMYVFVTRSSWTGNLGGLPGADAKCNAAAVAASLPGTYRAILIDGTVNLDERIPDAGPWYRVDGQLAFADQSEVLSVPRVAISLDENGDPATGYGSAWTGVIKHGNVSGSTCSGWTSSNAGGDAKAGDITATSRAWIDANPSTCPTWDCGPSCSTGLHLYCIQE